MNIFSLKINNVSNNGSINIGEALHNAPTANTKSQGQMHPTEIMRHQVLRWRMYLLIRMLMIWEISQTLQMSTQIKCKKD
ncbi:spore germination protein [Neobacillus sp. PS3-34]|uniref:spore germination protein n=1 Tax=Neobacillus sp. PS3-34 TaxID=3070678 RepID=UPI0035A72CAC